MSGLVNSALQAFFDGSAPPSTSDHVGIHIPTGHNKLDDALKEARAATLSPMSLLVKQV
jgi:hypothetical protein